MSDLTKGMTDAEIELVREGLALHTGDPGLHFRVDTARALLSTLTPPPAAGEKGA